MNTRLKNAAPDIIAARNLPQQRLRRYRGSSVTVLPPLGGHQADSRAWGEYSGLDRPVVFNDLLKWLNALDEKYALG